MLLVFFLFESFRLSFANLLKCKEKRGESMLTTEEVTATVTGSLAGKPLNDAAMGHYMEALKDAKSAVDTMRGAATSPYEIMKGAGGAAEVASEAGSATTTVVSDYGAAVSSAAPKTQFLSAASSAAKGVGFWQAAQAVKNVAVVSTYAQEEQNGTLIVPDTNGRAMVRDFTVAIDNAKKTGKVSDEDMFNLYGDAVVCQLFGAEARFDPNASSPIHSADIAGRYGEALKSFAYEKSGREQTELYESKAEVRSRRKEIAKLRSKEYNIPTIEEQLSYRRDYSKG